MLKLCVAYESRAHLIQACSDEPTLGGVFVPGSYELRSGVPILLELLCHAERKALRTPALVRWRRTRSSPALAAGLGVEFTPSLRDRDDPLRHAPDALFRDLRRGNRYRVAYNVEYQLDGASVVRRITDVSRSGAFIETDRAPEIGEHLSLRLVLPGSKPIDLIAEAVRRSPKGIGVEFPPDVAADRARVGRLMANTAVRYMEAHGGRPLQ